MLGVFRPEPNFLAVVTGLNAGRFSVRAEIPSDISQLKCEAFFGLNQSVWRYFPVWARGLVRSEPEVLAVIPSLNARCFSARTKTSGDISQFKCGASVGQNQNSWRYLPPWMRGVFSVRTAAPGSIYQFGCEACFGRNQDSWRYFPV